MKTVRAGICVLVTFAVAAFGSVGPQAEFIMVMGTLGLLVIWSLRAIRLGQAQVRRNGLYLPLLGLCGVAAAQTAFGLTAYPYATKVELLKLGAYLFLGFLAVESFPGEKELETLVWFLASLGFFVSLFGVVQYFTWDGKLYWVWEVANASTSFGPFVDRDHFAGFVELTAPFAFALLFSGAARQDALPLASLFGVLPVGASVLSASRGGIVSLFVELVILEMLVGRRSKPSVRLLRSVLIVVLCGAASAWLGIEGASQRFKNLAASGISGDRRISIYRDTWRIFLEHRWIGTGLGTLEAVFPRYESFYDGAIVDHAHNDYLELLADTGIAGGACGLLFIALLFRRGLSNLQQAVTPLLSAFYGGALAACAGFLLHSAVDFNLHIPSNALLFFLLAFLACSPVRSRSGAGKMTRPAELRG